jgi:hypothetical protein
MRDAEAADDRRCVRLCRLEGVIEDSAAHAKRLQDTIAEARTLLRKLQDEVSDREKIAVMRLQTAVRTFLARRRFRSLWQQHQFASILQPKLKAFRAQQELADLRTKSTLQRFSAIILIQRWWKNHRKRMAKRLKRKNQRPRKKKRKRQPRPPQSSAAR